MRNNRNETVQSRAGALRRTPSPEGKTQMAKSVASHTGGGRDAQRRGGARLDQGKGHSDQRRSGTGEPGRSGQLVSEIAGLIRSRILKGTLAPGERVRESVIAAEKGVSRAPVREAMRLLERAGIVSKSPNHSYLVTRFGERDIHELATLRA